MKTGRRKTNGNAAVRARTQFFCRPTGIHGRIPSGDEELRKLTQNWADRKKSLTETPLEEQFTSLFFMQIWGYWGTGGKGAADLALG